VTTGGGGGGHHRLELVATVLLAIATVATAWSGYQSTRWNGEQSKAAARANALRIASAKSAGLANSQTEIDVATFTQWVNAYAQKQTVLADFYFKRFRKEFRPAVDAWVATRPLKNPSAPLTPFAMPQYKLAARVEADRLDAEAELNAAQARAYIQRASNYVLGVVLFASALFFAGMSAKLTSPRLRVAMLAIGCAVFLLTALWIATSPVSVTV
jgi:Na+-translocating ferredoxin:NAD+ oxidoreductase RnfD subunit